MKTYTKDTLIKITVALVLVCAFCAWLYYSFDRVEKEEVEFSNEYRKNSYFLLKLFLEKQNFAVTQANLNSDIDKLDDKIGTLLLLDAEGFYSKQNNEKINDWILNGGHLISDVTHEIDELEGEFYSEFVLVNTFDEELEQAYETCYTNNSAWIDCDDRDVLTAGIEYETLASNSHGSAFISFEHGKGKITVFSHVNAFKNKNLIENDNAFFLASLVNPNKTGILLINQTQDPTLINSLWATAKLQIILFIGMLSLLLWSLIQRFGPLKAPDLDNRQDLKQHLTACADYLWQEDQLWSATRQLQDNIKTKAQRGLGRQLNLKHSEQQTVLVDYIKKRAAENQTPTSSESIYAALFGNLPNDEKELTNQTKLLQALWRIA